MTTRKRPTTTPAPQPNSARRKDLTGYVERRDPGFPLPSQPWMAPPYDRADVMAMKALRNGVATPEQQKRALAWVIECAARTYTRSFDADNPANRDFNEGCRHVGLAMVMLMNTQFENRLDAEQA